jgi:putative sensory transduction regulator
VRPADIERWLDDLGLASLARADRDGVTSWDLRLDGRRRFDLPVTLILDPSLALIAWVHFAPPIGDAYRKSFRKLLRWNDEFPFVKFSLAEDDRPVLATELPLRSLAGDAAGRDELGVALARSLLIADQLLEESASWLWIGGRIPDPGDRTSRNAALLERYADRLGELAPVAVAEPAGSASPPELESTGARR